MSHIWSHVVDNIIRSASSLLFIRLGEDVTHKVKVTVLRHLPVVGKDVLGLDVVAGLLLRLVVVVVLLLLGCLV